MGKILYYIILFPFSILPLSVLYVFSYFVYLLFYYILGYRKKVVLSNIRHSFPDLHDDTRKQIAKSFYKHFSDILVEGIKNLSISKKNLEKRGLPDFIQSESTTGYVKPTTRNRKKFPNFSTLGNEARPQKMASTPLERAVEKQIEVILKNPGEAWDRRVKALNALSSIFEE